MTFRILISTFLCSLSWAQTDAFTFHVNEEPSHLNPFKIERLTGNYVLGNLFSGFLRLDENLKLQPALAQKCVWKNSLHAVCKMRTGKWSNGKVISLQAYVDSMLLHLKQFPESYVSEVLRNVEAKNGIKAVGKNEIHFRFTEPDADFFYRIAVPAFSPLPSGIETLDSVAKDYATGPYMLSDWIKGKSLKLTSNPHFTAGQKVRPNVQVLFVAEDLTALSLFQKGKLNLLRRLTPAAEKEYQNSEKLLYYPFLRFDYLGFGGALKDAPELREALATSLDYDKFMPIFFSKTPPGCFSIGKDVTGFDRCYKFKQREKKFAEQKNLKLFFAEQGGDNIARSVQWYQNQWKTNLGITFRLEQEDWKTLGVKLKTNPPDAFRRGVPLDRPTCLAALEIFESTSDDNFIRFKNSRYDDIVKKMKTDVSLSGSAKRKLCVEALGLLLDSHQLIPLGEMRIAVLHDHRFRGWSINALNQLDLSSLELVSK